MSDVTMELAKESFSHWRSTRTNQAEPIPEGLWCMALELYPKYKRSTICEQLRLSGSGFKQRLEKGRTEDCNTGFVLASQSDVTPKARHDGGIQLTIQGKERALTITLELDALSAVVPHLGVLL